MRSSCVSPASSMKMEQQIPAAAGTLAAEARAEEEATG